MQIKQYNQALFALIFPCAVIARDIEDVILQTTGKRISIYDHDRFLTDAEIVMGMTIDAGAWYELVVKDVSCKNLEKFLKVLKSSKSDVTATFRIKQESSYYLVENKGDIERSIQSPVISRIDLTTEK